MDELGKLVQDLGQTKLDLMGHVGLYLLGYTRGRQVAFGGPYSGLERLRVGFRHRKNQEP